MTGRADGPRRILLVDDEEEVRLVAKMALESVGGFEVRECASGAEALAVAGAADVDLVLLDVMMPGMDGIAALDALRRIPGMRTTPIIFMTAKVQPSEIRSYLSHGAIGVIPKPFSPMDLSGQIRRIWREHVDVPALRLE